MSDVKGKDAMGFLDRFRAKRAAKEVVDTRSEPSVATASAGFETWVDPQVAAPEAEWERRLNAYARKSAGVLRDAGVPLFRSKWPRDSNGTFRDAFWLVACDVERAQRSWIANTLDSSEQMRLQGNPPPAQKGEHVGHLMATSLLLTSSGILCVARTEGFLTRSGGVDDREMDMIFTEIDRPVGLLRTHDWGWSNRGRWRRDPKSDIKAYGLDLHIHTIRFEEKFYRMNPPEDGRGTSAALTNFVKTSGSVRWPRGFISFDY